MISPILSRRRWLLKAHDRHIVIVKGTHERLEHPLMKALLWALYLPLYPHITVEVAVADRYKPDVVAFDPANVRFRANEPVFWGEAGSVGRDKLAALFKRYPDTHFAIAKWASAPARPADLIRTALDDVARRAPVDLLCIPAAAAHWIDAAGVITVTLADVERITWPPA